MNRVRAGFCEVRNPFDARRLRRVSLRPEDVDCIAFWTRDPRPLLAAEEELRAQGFAFFVHVTITGYPRILEPHVVATDDAIEAFSALAARIGPELVVWRYDPIIFARGREGQPELDADYHLRSFEQLAQALQGATRRVVISFLDEYRGTRSALNAAGYGEPRFGSPLGRRDEGAAELDRECLALAGELAAIARHRGMEPRSCAEPANLAAAGIEPAACIDPALVARAVVARAVVAPDVGKPLNLGRDKGQRSHCLCAPSVDIGAYGICRAECVYCYARRGSPRPVSPTQAAL